MFRTFPHLSHYMEYDDDDGGGDDVQRIDLDELQHVLKTIIRRPYYQKVTVYSLALA